MKIVFTACGPTHTWTLKDHSAKLYDTYSKRGINIALLSGAIPEHRTDGTYEGVGAAGVAATRPIFYGP